MIFQIRVGVKDTIMALDFEHAIILRPGIILGKRETSKAPFLENLIGSLRKISPSFQDLIGMLAPPPSSLLLPPLPGGPYQ